MAKKRSATPKQRVTSALSREIAAQKVLNNPKASKKAKAKAKKDIKLARRIQKRGYRSARAKIQSHDTKKKVRTKDAARKSRKVDKKSSAKGKKTKATSKRTKSRSQKKGSRKKR